jgi:hypothetical protein
MKSYTKELFLTEILNNVTNLPVDNSVINEFKIGNDFFYSLTSESLFETINKNLIDKVLNDIEINSSAIAFRKGKSYYDFLSPHKKNYNFLRLDIKSYFHSIRLSHVKACLEPYFKSDKNHRINNVNLIDYVMKYCTYTVPDSSKNTQFIDKTILPIGFPSSPVISNIIFRKIDIQLQKLCFENNLIYTRYADDMLFSSVKKNELILTDEFESKISTLLATIALKLNPHKTIRKRHTISLNGYVIEHNKSGGSIRLSNKKLNHINKITHYGLVKKETPVVIMDKLYNVNIDNYKFRFGPDQSFFNRYCKDQLSNKICGYRSYLLSIIQYNKHTPCLDDKYYLKYKKVVERLERLLLQIS